MGVSFSFKLVALAFGGTFTSGGAAAFAAYVDFFHSFAALEKI